MKLRVYVFLTLPPNSIPCILTPTGNPSIQKTISERRNRQLKLGVKHISKADSFILSNHNTVWFALCTLSHQSLFAEFFPKYAIPSWYKTKSPYEPVSPSQTPCRSLVYPPRPPKAKCQPIPTLDPAHRNKRSKKTQDKKQWMEKKLQAGQKKIRFCELGVQMLVAVEMDMQYVFVWYENVPMMMCRSPDVCKVFLFCRSNFFGW